MKEQEKLIKDLKGKTDYLNSVIERAKDMTYAEDLERIKPLLRRAQILLKNSPSLSDNTPTKENGIDSIIINGYFKDSN